MGMSVKNWFIYWTVKAMSEVAKAFTEYISGFLVQVDIKVVRF